MKIQVHSFGEFDVTPITKDQIKYMDRYVELFFESFGGGSKLFYSNQKKCLFAFYDESYHWIGNCVV